MDRDEWTGQEREALRQLPREAPVPAGLEDRVVAGLRRGGLVRVAQRRLSWRLVAAGLALAAAGFVAGRATTLAPDPSGPGNRYLLLLYGAASTPETESARVREYGEWARQEQAAGRVLTGEKLTAATATLTGGSTVSTANERDPSGFFIVRAASSDEARRIAASCPHLRHGGTVVVRPIAE